MTAAICQSGNCVDGRCCESACEGSCRTCDGKVPGACEPDTAPECITGSIAVKVTGVSRDISVVVSGPQQYVLTVSGGEVVQAGAPGGTYSVECQELDHYTVAVETQDDTIDGDGELISFTCVYTTTAPPDTGFIEVYVVGHSNDVFIQIHGPGSASATYRSSGGIVVVEDALLGTYQVTCEELSGYRLTVETDDDTVDFTGEIITFTCRYDLIIHWMAVGEGGQIIWSEDAVNWVERPMLIADDNLHGAAYGDGVLVIIGDEGIYRSLDKKTWHPVPLPDQLSNYTSIIFAEDKFLMTDDRGSVWLSSDGYYWEESGPGDVNLIARGIAYGNGRYVVVGRQYSLSASITYYSDDLQNWVNSSPLGNGLNAVAWRSNNFMAVGEDAQGWWSPDGGETPWEEISIGLPYGDFLDVAAGFSRFVAVGAGRLQRTDADAPTSWSNVYDCGDYTGIGYGSGTFVAVGDYGGGCISDDGGRYWDSEHLAGDLDLNDVIFIP